MPKSPLGEAISKIISKVVFIPKVSLNATPKGKAVCGESRTHGLEGVVEGRPSTTTLLIRETCVDVRRITERCDASDAMWSDVGHGF